MIVGGVVFRVVTPNHPGCPTIDAAGAPPIRTEYLASDKEPWTWALTRDDAHFFTRHLDAETVAKRIVGLCHAAVAPPPNQNVVPERLRPRPELMPPPWPSARRPRTPKNSKSTAIKMDPVRAAQCLRDPVEAD